MIWFIRGLFIILAFAVGFVVRNSMANVTAGKFFEKTLQLYPYLMAALAASLVVVEKVFQKRYLRSLVAVFLGLVLGVGVTYVVTSLLTILIPGEELGPYLEAIIPIAALFIIYLCITVVMQTGDQFRFIIPYVDFSKQGRSTGGFVLDTSAIIDGRFAELVQAGVADRPAFVPQFVLGELHALADSEDRLKRSRGKRGLENLEKLRSTAPLQINIREGDYPEMTQVDHKLIRVAKETDTRLVTADVNLARVASAEDVAVVDLHALTRSLRLVISPGDELQLKLQRPGEEPGQAVGYLEDGSMVVVESAHNDVGKTIEIKVHSIIQTSGGRMLFARPKDNKGSGTDAGNGSAGDEPSGGPEKDGNGGQ